MITNSGATGLVIAGTIAVGLLAYKGAQILPKLGKDKRPYLTQVLRAEDDALRLQYPLGLDR